MNQKHYFQDLNKIVDSHCHLDFQDFDNDRDKIINNAKISNVDYFLTISVNLEDFDKVYEVTQNYENIWCTTGIHPNNVGLKINSFQFENIKRNILGNLKNNKVVGLGETGLDFFRGKENRKNQIESFMLHLFLSGDKKYPTIVHTREADDDTINCLNESVKKYSSTGLIHCFTSTKQFAKKALDNGFYISFSGIITFKNAIDLVDVVKYVPLDKILVETDSPYLAPVPFRGKRNEPSYVNYTLEKISQIKKIKKDELIKITTKNFFTLFSKIKNDY
jgi:TatD DNase family protein